MGTRMNGDAETARSHARRCAYSARRFASIETGDDGKIHGVCVRCQWTTGPCDSRQRAQELVLMENPDDMAARIAQDAAGKRTIGRCRRAAGNILNNNCEIGESEMIVGGSRKVNVQIQASYPSGNNGLRNVSLIIKDCDASVPFVEVDISFADFTALLSTRAVTIPATVRGLDRVGKRMEIDTTMAGRDDSDAVRVRDQYLADGWQHVTFSRTAGGNYRVVARRWVEKDPADGGGSAV